VWNASAAALFGILAGGEIAGIWVSNLSIPVMASLRIVWRRWRIYAENARFGTTQRVFVSAGTRPGRISIETRFSAWLLPGARGGIPCSKFLLV